MWAVQSPKAAYAIAKLIDLLDSEAREQIKGQRITDP
jgi:hypothetical protein